MNTINNSDAGVRLTYSGLSDTFKMEATSTGAKYGIQLSQQEGDLLSKLFGSDVVRSASSVASSRLTVGEIAGRPGGLEDGYRTTSASLKLNVNGKDYTFTLPKKKDVVYSKDVIEAGFNAWLAESFGTTGEGDAEQANLSYENGVLHAADGFVVQFTATKVDVENPKAVAEAAQTDLALAFGFNTTAQSNIAAASCGTLTRAAFSTPTARPRRRWRTCGASTAWTCGSTRAG